MKTRHPLRTAAGILSLALILGNAGLLPAAAAGGVTFNEVCSKNTTMPAPDGSFYDWIELYNPGSAPADLSGCGLSDKAAEPFRYTFPAGTSVPAGGTLVVWCDSNAALTNPSYAPFGLSTSGETLTLTDAAGNAVDTLTFGALAADTTYGQYPDGSGIWYTLSGTPGNANAAPEGSNAVQLPEFSAASGFYDSAFDLTITAPAGTTVYYTTDGSDPSTDSEKYSAPIRVEDMTNTPNRLSAKTDIAAGGADAPSGNVDKAAVIRAVAVDAQGRISDPVTRTYFVGKTNSGYYKTMKVVSLVTDPDNLFDYETGIYCLGKVYDEENQGSQNPWGGWGGWPGFGGKQPWEMDANYTQKGREWEREASFTLFENGQEILSQNVGIRIKGAASRSAPQKSFNVYARQDYGTPELAFDFFDGKATKAKNGKTISKYEGIVLRNGGNDTSYAFFRDSINQALVSDRSFATQATNECIVLIDGEFWGIYQITEKLGKDYLKDHYGVKGSDVAIVKNNALEEGTDQDLADWDNLQQGVANGSISYEQFCEKVDIQSYIDYYAAQIYWCNADWPQNNNCAWRCNAIDETNPYADGKWRMFLFDTEYNTGLYSDNNTSVNANVFSRISSNTDDWSRCFTKLLSYDAFRLQFASTMMDLANYNFAPDRTKPVISFYQQNYQQQILDTFARFYSRDLSGQKGQQRFNEEYSTITNFYNQRPDAAERTMRQALSLRGDAKKLTVNSPEAEGYVQLNTLTLDDVGSTWSGKYHSDYDLHLTAVPKPGSSFSHWEITGGTITEGTEQSASVSVKMDGDTTITAVYSDTLVGDYDANGVVDVRDAVLLQKYLVGEKVTLARTDVHADGITDIFDLAALKHLILNR
ncbi:MAG: CotH kinase family protein [Oscillospiraceae bacterium]|nr:CotH kinase family protein [Oscillospiraceae bacterium]